MHHLALGNTAMTLIFSVAEAGRGSMWAEVDTT
jgi:hypothetical protein